MSKAKTVELTQSRLKELVRYDQKSGRFFWLKNPRGFTRGAPCGYLNARGYVDISIDGCCHKAHRLAWLYETGSFPPHDIDHIDGNRSNNKFKNLRSVTRSMNLENRRAPGSHNKSGFLGVGVHAYGFTALITVKGKTKYLGYFKKAEDAHATYLAAKRLLHEGCMI